MIATAPVAPVVTATTWERTMKATRYRKATTEIVTYRTAHAREDCTRIKRTEIVARDVPIDTAPAGLPCDYCWPRDAAEAPEPVRGLASEQRSGEREPGVGDHHAGGTPAPGSRPNVRRNRYPDACTKCGSMVAAQSGELVRTRNGKWGARHFPGECQPTAGRAAGAQSDREHAGRPVPSVAAGHYAVHTPAGLVFIRVDRPTEGKWAGRTFVKRIIGGHPDEPIRGAEGIALLVLVENDPASAAARYGREIGRCHRCNRVLTDPESRRLGIGPECRTKG